VSNYMTVTSSRAQAVAEILWELKTAEKLATHSAIAERVGFSPGAGGRIMITCLKTVRRDWPQLQWWRAVSDTGQVEQEQQTFLNQNGFETEASGGVVIVKAMETETMSWAAEDAPALNAQVDADSEPVGHST
jgi:methylated-DNA-protein-cysteine methyltransferase related protein